MKIIKILMILGSGIITHTTLSPAGYAAESQNLIARVKQDMISGTTTDQKMSGTFAYYVVPPMSNIIRTQTSYPEDGVMGGAVQMIAAQGEFEPASIVFFPFVDSNKVELKVSDLTGNKGTISSSAIDIKIVKVWYQAGTAWYSYFADTQGRKLVPELLLNDENLIRVDMQTQDNYLRVDYPEPRGSEYVWISNPYQIEIPFNDLVEPVDDATTLQPFSFVAGTFKQIWITFEAPKDAEGIYKGTISVMAEGKSRDIIPLEVRVLPFTLPDPKTNYDLNRKYYTSVYNESALKDYLHKNGGDKAGALRRLTNEYSNMRKHNILYPMFPDRFAPGEEYLFLEQLEAYKKAGLRTDVLFGGIPAIPRIDWMSSPAVQGKPLSEQPPAYVLFRRIDNLLPVTTKALGHSNIYAFGWDEPSLRLLTAERGPWKYVHDKGVHTYSTANHRHLLFAGYNEDFVNYGGKFSKEDAEVWHQMGARITSYANPHTGPENPDFARRTHGFELYRNNADGTNNYMLNGSPWNDFAGAVYNFRAFNLIYPGKERPIDTLQWEGIREGIDDVRYATLLKQLAEKAIATEKTEAVYEGKKALLWLAMQNPKTVDLNALRIEMIHYILQLREIQ